MESPTSTSATQSISDHGTAMLSQLSCPETPDTSRESVVQPVFDKRPRKLQKANRSSQSSHSATSHASQRSRLSNTSQSTSITSHSEEAIPAAQSANAPPPMDPPNQPSSPQYPSKPKLIVIMLSVYIAVFLVALDRTIIGTAIPQITNHFHSIDDIGWYGSSYMLTSCSFILLYGRLYTLFNTKWTFLSGILLFEIGSAICGAAPTSLVLILGRAIAGLGSSGIFTGAISIMLHTVPLHQRPMLQGLFGASFGVASVAGPLLGGVFTESKATWRWCFYINLPLGGFTMAAVGLLLQTEEKKPRSTWKQTFFDLDPLGTMLFLPSIICLLLALQWGGTDMAWSDGRMIALLVVFASLFVAFVALQYFTRNTTASVPARIISQRSISFGGVFQFLNGAAMLTVSIYLPLWFQAIKGVSAMTSGIDTIPLVLSVVVASILSGGIVQRVGYYTQFLWIGSALMAIGAGLLTTFTTSTGHAHWIGYQVIFGLGVGFSMQQPSLAVQTVLAPRDVPTGTALMTFCQTLGGAVFVAVSQNLFLKKFVEELWKIRGLDPRGLIKTGATALKNVAEKEFLPQVLRAYNTGIVKGPFLAALIVSCGTVIAAVGMEWRSVKEGIAEESSAGTSGVRDEESTSVDSQPSENVEKANGVPIGSGRPCGVFQRT